jgi:hypothetical protein
VHQQRLSNAWRYLLSGGLNFRQLVPSVLAPVIRVVEALQRPVDHVLALHHVIVLRKRPVP